MHALTPCSDFLPQDANSPLHTAVLNGNTAIARLLIQAGANVQQTNRVWLGGVCPGFVTLYMRQVDYNGRQRR